MLMINMNDYALSKERILMSIKSRGPSLPIQIARDLGVSTLFAAAFLSDLKAEGKVNMSIMKVGSSPLYFISGQELELEKFIEHLNQREKEALALLKKEKVLEDEKQEPVVRVALRAIKDFAIDIRVNTDEGGKLFWKHFSISDDDFVRIVEERLGIRKPVPSIVVEKIASPVNEKINREKIETAEEKMETVSDKIEKKHGKNTPAGKIHGKKMHAIQDDKDVQKGLDGTVVPVLKKMDKVVESELTKTISEYLLAKDVELRQTFVQKKKEFEGVVRIDSLFGKQELYLIVKDKKIVSDSDLLNALQKAQAKKMPALVMASGELNKKAKEYLREWGNLIRFEQIDL